MTDVAAPKVPRNRSIRFQDHEGLLRKLAKRYYARLLGAQIMGLDFDDVMGELSLAFVKAAKGYDPQSEFSFTAFLGRCCQNHFNKYAKRLMLEQFGEEAPVDLDNSGATRFGLGYISADAMGFVDDTGSTLMSLYEFVESDTFATPEEACNAGMTLKAIINDPTLSVETRVYISILANPLMEVSEKVRERIRSGSLSIRKEIGARFGVQMPAIRV